jgi:hypothetical protein
MVNNLIIRGKAAKTGQPTRYVICDPDDRCITSVVQRHQKENPDIEIHVAKSMSSHSLSVTAADCSL